MCGVFGFSQLDKQTGCMAAFLAFSMEGRGHDSWGGSNGDEIIKRLGPISASWFLPRDWKRGIFHTRLATVGAKTERNSHPFEVFNTDHSRRLVGLHNGGVSNYHSLNTKYSRNCEVDSEHIFHHLADNLPMHELSGRGTLVWIDSNEASVINLARWSYGDLEVAELEDHGICFASQREPIERAARMARIKIKNFYQPLVDGYRHTIDGVNLYKHEDLKFTSPNSANNYNSGWYEHGRHNRNYSSNWQTDTGAAKCKRCHQIETKKVICAVCMRSLREEFEHKLKHVADQKTVLHGPVRPKITVVNGGVN